MPFNTIEYFIIEYFGIRNSDNKYFFPGFDQIISVTNNKTEAFVNWDFYFCNLYKINLRTMSKKYSLHNSKIKTSTDSDSKWKPKTILGIFRGEVYPGQYVGVVTYRRPRMTGADISRA